MHILEIPSFLPPLGGEFCLQQAKALSQLGHEVRILSCNLLGLKADAGLYLSSRWTAWTEEMNGLTTLRANLHGLPRCTKWNKQRYVKAVLNLYKQYKKRYGKPDVLHAHCCLWGGVAARHIAEQEDIPYVITEHLSKVVFDNTFGNGWQHDGWAKQLLRETYEKAAAVIPVSAELTNDLAPYFGTAYSAHPISNMIDTDFFAYKERPARQNRPFRLCCIAINDVYRKGYDMLAKAFEGMENTELYLAGKGTDTPAMKQLFCRCKDVTFLGKINRQKVRELLYQCDALVLASRSEAQGLVILEALCTGIPVVTTDAIPQNAIHLQACLIAKHGDVNSLREKLFEVQSVTFNQKWSGEVAGRVAPGIIAHQIAVVLKASCKG